MPSLTNGEIQKALKQVDQTGKQLTLIDGEGRGTGRLVLVIKPMPTRVTADWMAQQWRDEKRIKKKLGSYPSMSLADARKTFQRDFANLIQKGRSIKIAGDTRPGTVADLFEAYVDHLKRNGKVSWKETEKGLNKIADTLGRNRPAREIEPDEVVEVIRPIYERGKSDGRSCALLHPCRLQLGPEVRTRLSEILAASLHVGLQSRRRHSDRTKSRGNSVARRERVRPALPVARMS